MEEYTQEQSQPTESPQTPQPNPELQQITTPEVKGGGTSLKKTLVIVITIGILVGIGVFVIPILKKQREGLRVETKPTVTAAPTLLQQKENIPYTSYQTIILSDQQGGINSGSATRSIIPEHVFVSILGSLSDPPEGQFYQVWLGDNQGDNVLVGFLIKEANGQYTSVADLKTPSFSSFGEIFYNHLIVTQETIDDTTPETKILEGTFTQ